MRRIPCFQEETEAEPRRDLPLGSTLLDTPRVPKRSGARTVTPRRAATIRRDGDSPDFGNDREGEERERERDGEMRERISFQQLDVTRSNTLPPSRFSSAPQQRRGSAGTIARNDRATSLARKSPPRGLPPRGMLSSLVRSLARARGRDRPLASPRGLVVVVVTLALDSDELAGRG